MNGKIIKNSNEYKELYIKALLIFQVIFHEYNHFIADTYINSIPLSSSQSAKHIYSVSSHKRSNWDADFVSKFKSYLNYSIHTKKASDSFININNVPTPYKSIGSLFDAKDLFELTNEHENIEYQGLDNGNYIFAGKNTIVNYQFNTQKVIEDTRIKKQGLQYTFSLEEVIC